MWLAYNSFGGYGDNFSIRGVLVHRERWKDVDGVAHYEVSDVRTHCIHNARRLVPQTCWKIDRFDGHHVALVVWYPAATGEADEVARMQRFVRELGVAVQAGAAPLFVATDRSTGWAWLSFQVAPDGIVARVADTFCHSGDEPAQQEEPNG